jgi:hypothetical protein
MKCRINVSYAFRSDEPSGVYEAKIRKAFAELGGVVTDYGGGSWNVHWWYIDIESDDRALDRPEASRDSGSAGHPRGGDDIGIHGDLSLKQ